jgi:hypothetical protein
MTARQYFIGPTLTGMGRKMEFYKINTAAQKVGIVIEM